MSHFAKVTDGIVQQVIVAEPEFFETFIDNSPGEWIQCSYNTIGGVHLDPETREPDGGKPVRKNFPSRGFTYDRERDAFIPPKPFASWILNEQSCLWEAPVPHPDDGGAYTWSENDQQWISITQEQV